MIHRCGVVLKSVQDYRLVKYSCKSQKQSCSISRIFVFSGLISSWFEKALQYVVIKTLMWATKRKAPASLSETVSAMQLKMKSVWFYRILQTFSQATSVPTQVKFDDAGYRNDKIMIQINSLIVFLFFCVIPLWDLIIRYLKYPCLYVILTVSSSLAQSSNISVILFAWPSSVDGIN